MIFPGVRVGCSQQHFEDLKIALFPTEMFCLEH